MLAANSDSAGFTFCKPAECDVFDGHEALIAKSQEARRNTKSMMEILRPFLEGLGYKDGKIVSPSDFAKEGHLEVNLFDKEGNMKTSVQLKVNTDELLFFTTGLKKEFQISSMHLRRILKNMSQIKFKMRTYSLQVIQVSLR